ncbi:hypothetical protein QOZ80_9AG0679310 [Eleusine coracana subsp. coracana]|nr:hypothetical protein QOZ80_9AG0679310 [Eleusine coracana subsp. coracana]
MAAAAAAAKLVAVRGAPRTTTHHHRPISTAPLAASATTPVTVSLSSSQHDNKQESVVVVATTTAIEKGAVSPASGSLFGAEAMEDSTPSLASMWQEVHGAGDWHGLVDPLHPVLRAEIVRYGELVAACYRAFDLDPRSKRYLNCKHGKTQMLPSIGMAGAGRRPGTVTGSEWLANFNSVLTPARFDPADPRPDVRVESGFLSLYTSDDGNNNRFSAGSCRNQLLSEIARLVAEHGQEEHGISITLAGHSMGSSLALLLGYDLAELGLNRNPHDGRIIPITVFSFAGPRVGNREFRSRCDDLGVKVLRVVNVNDPVTKMPGFVFNDGARALAGRYGMPWGKACYTHVGVEVALDFFKAGDIACAHDLEAYIDHLLHCDADDITVAHDELVREDDELQGVSHRVASLFNSWRWQMAAIRAGQLMQVIGI